MKSYLYNKNEVYRITSNYFPELIKITRKEYRSDLESYIIYYEKIVILTKNTIVHNECYQLSKYDHFSFAFDNLSREKRLTWYKLLRKAVFTEIETKRRINETYNETRRK